MIKAYRISTNTRIAPFDDLVSEIPILNKPFADVQKETLLEAGFEIVSKPPMNEPYLIFSDRIWFSAEIVRRLGTVRGQLRCSDQVWANGMHALQDLKGDGRYEIAMLEAGQTPDFNDLSAVEFDWSLRDSDPMDLHPSMAHAQKSLRVGPCMAHHLFHWSHILRINQLAIANIGESIRMQWKQKNIFGKIWLALLFIFKMRTFNREKVLARIGTIGKNCQIHSTAVVEACNIGDNVVIGPHAVVRASVIGDGVKVEEYATVNISVIGAGSRINRYSLANLCVFFERVMVSHGCGYQACVLGRDAFAAWDVTALDLSFGKSIRVLHRGEWVDSEQHFLGAALGHRSVLGNRVRLNYGVSVPNDAVLVGPIEDMIKDASAAEPQIAFCVDDNGGVKPIRKKGRLQPPSPEK